MEVGVGVDNVDIHNGITVVRFRLIDGLSLCIFCILLLIFCFDQQTHLAFCILFFSFFLFFGLKSNSCSRTSISVTVSHYLPVIRAQ